MEQSTLGGFSIGECLDRVDFGVVRPHRGEAAARATLGHVLLGNHPVAAGDQPIRTVPQATRTTIDAFERELDRTKGDQLTVFGDVSERGPATQAGRVVEEQQLLTDRAWERLHALKLTAIVRSTGRPHRPTR